MKKNIPIFTILTVALLLVLFPIAKKLLHKKSTSSYVWDGLSIEIQSQQENPIALWDTESVTKEELIARSPHLKEKTKSTNELEQIAIDSDYYFSVLSTAQNILIEKLVNSKNLRKEIPNYTNFDNDFKDWRLAQNISDKALNPQQVNNLKLDFTDKFQKQEARKILTKLVPSPLKIYLSPPAGFIDWEQKGIASFGKEDAKIKILFFCDMMSPVCFESLHILQKATEKYKIQISYRPAPANEDIYNTLRMQIGMCLAKVDAKKFWQYYNRLQNQPKNLEEPELKNLTEADAIQMQDCMVSPSMLAEWESHKVFFDSLWKKTIPVLLVNGEPVMGPFTLERISELVGRLGI